VVGVGRAGLGSDAAGTVTVGDAGSDDVAVGDDEPVVEATVVCPPEDGVGGAGVELVGTADAGPAPTRPTRTDTAAIEPILR
jgi:hypothetical protein